MAYIIDLASGRTCGPSGDEGSKDDEYIAAGQLLLALHPSPVANSQFMPLDLVKTDPESFIAAMEKP